jgi:hypothetical protein
MVIRDRSALSVVAINRIILNFAPYGVPERRRAGRMCSIWPLSAGRTGLRKLLHLPFLPAFTPTPVRKSQPFVAK